MRFLLIAMILTAGVTAPGGFQCLQNGAPCGGLPRWSDQTEVTLDASGNAVWTFDLANPPPAVPSVTHLPRAVDTNNPIICNYMARSTVSVTIHCWRTNVSGLLSTIFGGSAAGAQVALQASAPRGQ